MSSRGKKLVEMALKRCAERKKSDCNNNEFLYSDYSSSEHDDDVRDPDFVPKKKKKKISERVDKIIHSISRTAKSMNASMKSLPLPNTYVSSGISSDSFSSNEENEENDIDIGTLPNNVMDLDNLLNTTENSKSENTFETDQIDCVYLNKIEAEKAVQDMLMCNETLSSDSSSVNDENEISGIYNETLSSKLMNPRELFDTRENIVVEEHVQTDQMICEDNGKTETVSMMNVILDDPVREQSSYENGEELAVDHEEVLEEDRTEQLREKIENSTKVQKHKNRLLRMTGFKYKGLKKNSEGKTKYLEERSERILTPSKCSRKCEKQNGGRKCLKIDSKTREEIFRLFWHTMDWKQKKLYVLGLVEKVDIKRRVVETDDQKPNRKKTSFKYFLKMDNERVPVCREMFLSTLGLNDKTVYNWLNTEELGIPTDAGIDGLPGSSRRRGSANSDARVHAQQFLMELPKLPSHYCRSSTSKQYLEPLFSSICDVHKEYIRKMTEESKPYLMRTQFSQLFKEMNIGLYRPKKDLCDICCGHQANTVSDTDYAQHIQRKDEARAEKDKDKSRAQKERNVKVLTVDLQSLLICPKLNASSIYYKMKLSCHNYTIFDLETKNVKCYFWHESDGELTANVFTTCIIDYLSELDLHVINHVIIFSDGCGYQNRNAILSNALLQFACDHKITIEQKFLERGHTQMECDSVHSVIERSIKDKPIYVPEQYVEKIRYARKGVPYDVNYVDYTFFKDFSQYGKYASIRPGTGVGSETVNNLRSLMYSETGVINYKTRFSSDYQALPTPRKSLDGNSERPPLYNKPLPLKRTKFNHLQQLKAVIPKDYHGFYDNLSHF